MSQFCVLVTSGDSRKDIFDVCMANSEHIWGSCNWPRYAGFTTLQPEQYGFKTLASGIANDWCKSVAAHIDALPADIRYILLMVEDVLFIKPVDAVRLNMIAEHMARHGLRYVRLVPKRRNWAGRLLDRMNELPPNLACARPIVEYIEPSEPYYSSTEMVIWERSYLRQQLDLPGDAWSFEHHIGRHAHYAVKEALFEQHQIVHKGKWHRRAAWYLAEAMGSPRIGTAVDIQEIITKTRPLQTWRSFLRGEWQNFNFMLFGFTTLRVKRWLGFC